MTARDTANDNFHDDLSTGDVVSLPVTPHTVPETPHLTQLSEVEVIATLQSLRLLDVWKRELKTAGDHYLSEHKVTKSGAAVKFASYQTHPNFSDGYETTSYMSDAMIALKHMGYQAGPEHTKLLHDLVDGMADPHSCALARDTIKSYVKALALLSHEMHAGHPQDDEDRKHFELGLHEFEREDALDPLRPVSKEAHPMYAAMYQIGDELAKCMGIEHKNPDVRATALANANVLAEERGSLIKRG